MGTLLRSRHMQLVQLYIPIDAAHDTVDELGKEGLVQFRDLNPGLNAFQRNFVDEVKRADEMERKLRYFEELLRKNKLFDETKKPAHVRWSEYSNAHFEDGENQPAGVLMNNLQEEFENYERELVRLNVNQEALERARNQLTELKHVLECNNNPEFSAMYSSVEENQPLMGGDASMVGGSQFITGTLPTEQFASFHKLIYRAMRGNVVVRGTDLEHEICDPNTGEEVKKTVFFILYTGSRSQTKIQRLCEAFGANIYECPRDSAQRKNMIDQTREQETDASNVYHRTKDTNIRMLTEVKSRLPFWKIMVMKEKSIYHTMNLFNYDAGRRCLIAEGWCPVDELDMEKIQGALLRGNKRSGASVPSILSVVETEDTPPTYFVTNRFTENFQNVIDAYGVGRYREINPAPFTIITFPFLFGVMFGDVGHGFLLFLVGLLFCVNEKKFGNIKLPEMVDTLYDGRWLFLFMTICSMYCGLLYNEVFGLPMDIFGTNWYYKTPYYQGEFADPYHVNGEYVYPFGVDPLWKGSNNELDFYNSLKMKMSVLMGVTQMLFGIVLSLFNAIYFARSRDPKAKKEEWLTVFMVWVPQMIFILAIFGYMDVLIIFKWITNWNDDQYIYNYWSAPSLLNLMIQMFLTPLALGPCNFYYDNPPEGCLSATCNPEHIYHLYNGQDYIQIGLTLLAIFAVPWMLFLKPLIIKRCHDNEEEEKALRINYGIVDGQHDTYSDSSCSSKDEEDEEEFDFGEMFTHQAIHTIEYVLGCISNTASYLRLWALSLAHSELAAVFWERVMQFMIDIGKWPAIFAGWAVWAFFTIAVLLVMESLSAFLHALRLHWVEFQNKFYMADGHKFSPFSYLHILKEEDELH